MPFRLFHVYERELFAHQALERVSATVAALHAKGGVRTESGDYTEGFLEDLELARIEPRRSR